MQWDFDAHARAFHRRLPGFIRATLVDHGISEAVIERRQLGWDGRHVTVPIVTPAGKTALFERWDVTEGLRVEPMEAVELYGWDVLARCPQRVIIAEGVHEALVFETHGFDAVSATGSGRFFKDREWGIPLSRVPEVIVAFKRGGRGERRKHLPTRAEVVGRILERLPRARVATWPPGVGRDGGAFSFFARQGHSAADFKALLR